MPTDRTLSRTPITSPYIAIGWALNRLAQQLDRSNRPAGFVRGLVQGALMPASMPNLAIGHDVAIYAVNNTGVFYKLGYTMGVNLCGAIFFGAFYWRLKRWRRRRRQRPGA